MGEKAATPSSGCSSMRREWFYPVRSTQPHTYENHPVHQYCHYRFSGPYRLNLLHDFVVFCSKNNYIDNLVPWLLFTFHIQSHARYGSPSLRFRCDDPRAKIPQPSTLGWLNPIREL